MKNTYSLYLIAAFTASGCSSQSSKSNSAAGLSILSKNSVELGETFDASVSNPDQVQSYRWVALSDSGAELTTCKGIEAAKLTCVAQEPGKIEVRAYARLHNNTDRLVTSSLDVLDPARFDNQKPLLLVNLSSASSVGRSVSVSSLRSKNQGDIYFLQNETITLDFSPTTVPGTATPVLSYAVDSGSGYAPVSGSSASVVFPETGAHLVKVKATDAAGHSSEKIFQLFTQCSSPNNVAVDASKITVTKVAGENNFFTYSAVGAASGGSGTYLYQWDFNGDEITESPGFDLDGDKAGNWYNNATVLRDRPQAPGVYTQYADVRKVTLKAVDKKCFFLGKASVDVNFAITRADGISGTKQGPQLPNHVFVQADITPTGFADPSVNVKDIATQKMTDSTTPRRVECNYSRPPQGGSGSKDAAFSVKGLYAYPKSQGLVTYQHGVELKVKGLKDSIPTGGSGSVDTSGAAVESFKYSTDGSGDLKLDRVFTANQGCVTNLSVDLTAGPGTPCGQDGKGTQGNFVAMIDGTYSCPAATDGLGRKAKVDKGAFYCEVSVVDECVGGCCCCSGGVPPKPI